MPYRSKKHWRDIGFRPDQNKWLEEQAGGPRGVSKVVEKCIDRVMNHTDAADRLERVEKQVTRIAATLDEANARLDTLAAFLDYQLWIGTNRNEAAYDQWHNDFTQWRKES
jgi:hypothetical protein